MFSHNHPSWKKKWGVQEPGSLSPIDSSSGTQRYLSPHPLISFPCTVLTYFPPSSDILAAALWIKNPPEKQNLFPMLHPVPKE